MKMIRRLTTLIAALAAVPALANPYDAHVSARLLPGWQQADGSHVAALEVTLSDGWKTYWRAPGDAGVPPVFSWSGSRNVHSVQVIWPRPEVFYQNGMRSIGYSKRMVLPLRIEPRGNGGQMRLDGDIQIGICSDVCVPMTLSLDAVQLPDQGRRDPAIAAALADRPYSGREVGLRDVSCAVEPGPKKMRLRAEIDMPAIGGTEHVVFETSNPAIWVAEAKTRREGNRLIAETELMQMNGQPFALDRSGLRLTVLGADRAVDIQGCPAR
jgi:DsbC/DsbD-like thiol-disulfide interchange protein